MLVLLMGPPGVGKGFQLLLLQKSLKKLNIEYEYFVFGDEFRRLAANDQDIKDKIARGDLIDDSTVNRVFNMLSIPVTSEKLIIIDGYPRSLGQAENLQRYTNIIPIFFYTTFEVLRDRLLNRRQCKNCNYCIAFVECEVCDKCGGKDFKIRSDDNVNAIKHRFEEYESVTKPIKKYFTRYKNYLEIESNRTPEDIHNSVMQHLRNIIQ